jgi:hypothetical protein
MVLWYSSVTDSCRLWMTHMILLLCLTDVWKSELSVFVSAKNVNMDIRIHIRF